MPLKQQSYEQALERTLFRDAVLMQLAARFTGMSAGGPCHHANDDAEDIEEDLEAAESDEDKDRSLLACMFNDPASRFQREMLAAALVREEQLMGQLRQKFAGWSAGKHKPCPHKHDERKHDDRVLRPSEYTMKVLGLRDVAVPAMMLN